MSKEPVIEDPKAIALVRHFAGEIADLYINQILIEGLCGVIKMFPASSHNLYHAIEDSATAFRIVLGYYATSRRGGDRNLLIRMYLNAYERTIGKSTFEEYLESGDADALWVSYTEVCEELGKKFFEQQNRPVLVGLAKLAFEVYDETGHGNLLQWIRDEIVETHQAEHLFERLTDIPTIGPKSASHLLRDIVQLFVIEETVNYSDRHFLNPVNPVVRSVARYLLPIASETRIPDSVLAGKICRQVRLIEVSGVRFNMGCAMSMLRPIPGQSSIDGMVDMLYNSLRS